MAREFVAHPETGLPVEVETNYREVERQALVDDVTAHESEVSEKTNLVSQKQEELNQAQTDLTTAQAALEDSKSALSSYDAIASAAGVDVPTAEPSVEDQAGVEEVATEEVADEAPQF